MFNITGYANVFDVQEKGNIVALRLSSSDKQKDGKYKNVSWQNVIAVKDAKEKLIGLNNGSRVKVISGKITIIPYEKDGKKFYPVNLVLFDVEVAEKKDSKESSDNVESDGMDEDEMPV